MQEIVDVIETLRRASDEIADAARKVEQFCCHGAVEDEAEHDDGESEIVQPDKQEKPQPTFEEVRAVLADRSRAGFSDKIRRMLNRHGASRLSELDPGHYQAILAEAKELVDDVPF